MDSSSSGSSCCGGNGRQTGVVPPPASCRHGVFVCPSVRLSVCLYVSV